MENQEVLRSKPLSYEALKAVLKSLKLETREAVNRRIPALRTINSRLPYVLENVIIENRGFETNGRRWVIEQTRFQSNPLSHVVEPRMRVVTIYDFNSHKKAEYRLNKSFEEIWYQLFDEYIRDGTVVRGSLCIDGIPELAKRRENGRDLKIKVTNLNMYTPNLEDYEQFIRIIDLDVLENVKCVFGRNSLAILDKPEIKTCKKLIVMVHDNSGLPSVDQLCRLRNQHLYFTCSNLTLHDLQLFVQDWITTGRELGTRFSWETRRFELGDVFPILEHSKTHLGAVEAGSHLDYYFSDKVIHDNGITVKMGEDRELVMFFKKSKLTCYLWEFEMEVVASTIAADIVSV
ncbi:hypothetical protein CRE_17409 [Caenorhabditis remanei]|uniref:F-box associated domain-containing protein n=1 Tax=Caenorhabditis remanei TaxID=31234 RepID=E3N282_CAERE|nr:hypothetical protein CRE_17409 [Caenorhabditis remanei]